MSHVISIRDLIVTPIYVQIVALNVYVLNQLQGRVYQDNALTVSLIQIYSVSCFLGPFFVESAMRISDSGPPEFGMDLLDFGERFQLLGVITL